jgi:hypothetical protein
VSIKYIFSINSGRCGSDYLTELLSKAQNTVSIHEGLPMMNGLPMQKFNDGNDFELRQLMPLKIKQIKNKRKNSHRIYCETNHSFIKGWGYLIPDSYIPQNEIGVIILRRDEEMTAYSLLRSHAVPGISEWARTWYLCPNSSRNLTMPDDHADYFDICKWYVRETYCRADEYKVMFPQITYLECSLNDLNCFDFVIDMFKVFGIIPSKDLKDSIGSIINTRSERPCQPVKELLAPSQFDSADMLEGYERDDLIHRMVVYLQKTRRHEISKIKPDHSMAGSLIREVAGIVMHAENELENIFKKSLRFSETEGILVMEFLRAIHPFDLSFLACERSASVGIRYTYNFNEVFGLKAILKKLGWRALIQLLQMLNLAIWKQDHSHRQAAS